MVSVSASIILLLALAAKDPLEKILLIRDEMVCNVDFVKTKSAATDCKE